MAALGGDLLSDPNTIDRPGIQVAAPTPPIAKASSNFSHKAMSAAAR